MEPAPHCDEAASAARSSSPLQPDAKPMDAKLTAARKSSLAISLTTAGDEDCSSSPGASSLTTAGPPPRSWGGPTGDDEAGEACVFMPSGSLSSWDAFSLDGQEEDEEQQQDHVPLLFEYPLHGLEGLDELPRGDRAPNASADFGEAAGARSRSASPARRSPPLEPRLSTRPSPPPRLAPRGAPQAEVPPLSLPPCAWPEEKPWTEGLGLCGRPPLGLPGALAGERPPPGPSQLILAAALRAAGAEMVEAQPRAEELYESGEPDDVEEARMFAIEDEGWSRWWMAAGPGHRGRTWPLDQDDAAGCRA